MKTCAGCGEPFARPKGQTDARWAVMTACSHACVHKARTAAALLRWQTEKRTCLACGQPFGRSKGEAWSKFAKRDKCSISCAQRSRTRAPSPTAAKPARKGPRHPTRWGLPTSAEPLVRRGSRVERAADVLARFGAVFPAGVVEHPHEVKGRDSGVWMVHGRRMNASEMIRVAAEIAP